MSDTKYLLRWSNGNTSYHESELDARIAIVSHYGDDAEGLVIGHQSDLSSGGDRTLVWESDAEAMNDDGARAVASIRQIEIGGKR